HLLDAIRARLDLLRDVVARLDQRVGVLDLHHESLALARRAVLIGNLAPGGSLFGELHEIGARKADAEHFRQSDRGQVDGAACLQRQSGKLGDGLLLERLNRRARRSESLVRMRAGSDARGNPMIERATPEVVPEPLQARTLRLHARKVARSLLGAHAGLIELRVQNLAPAELPAVVLGDVLASLALVLLARQILDELLDELAPRLPQAA